MADTIAIMNQGVIEQLGAPQEVYERPASAFVADFIGAPAMNFLPVPGRFAANTVSISIGDATVPVPALLADAPGDSLLFGVRPEHVHFSTESKLRAEVLGTEYLGTSQIVTCRTVQGVTLRAKVGVHIAAQRGDLVGLEFDTAQVSLFDQASGRALQTARHASPIAKAPSRQRLGAPAFKGAAHG